jgi:hypothetical protein
MRPTPKGPRVVFHAGVLLNVAAVSTGVARPCRAGTSDIATQVRCPAFSAEIQAEFEARAQVDLSLRSAGGGELEVVCDGLEARVIWRPRSGATFERPVAAASSPRELLDALLVAGASLAGQANGAAPSSDAPSDPAARGAAASGRAADGLAASRETANGATANRAAGAMVASRGANQLESIGDEERGRQSKEREGREPAVAKAGPSSLALGLSLGAEATPFSTGDGSVGPSLGVLLGLPSGFVAAVYGDYRIGLGAGGHAAIRMFGATALVSVGLGEGRAFEVGVGASAGATEANMDAPYQPQSQNTEFLAAVARGRYALQWDPWRFALGADLHLYTAPTSVVLDGAELWKLPQFTAGLTFEVATRIYGQLW